MSIVDTVALETPRHTANQRSPPETYPPTPFGLSHLISQERPAQTTHRNDPGGGEFAWGGGHLPEMTGYTISIFCGQ